MQDHKIAELLGSTLTHDPKEVIYDLSSYVLSETKKALLCKRLIFAIPPQKLKLDNYLLQFEIFPEVFVTILKKLVMMTVC